MDDIPVPGMMDGKIYIFHVDANSAFLSWSASYRVNVLGEKTDLRSVPSIVGGDQEKRHGIVLAKSTPAKKYGIHTGEAIVTARQKCPGLVVIPPDYGLYVNASRAFIGRGQMKNFACRLKDEIREELGFTVNIGISTNFLLSKMAGDFSKPDKVHTLFPDEIPKKMWPLPVSDLFFVGRATTSKLHRLGIYTIGELAKADDAVIKSHLKLPGQIVQGYARGKDLEPYMFGHETNKGYGNSLTAPVDITSTEYADHLLLSLCETVGTRLRNDNVKISVVSVHITTCEFIHENKQMQLLTATDVTEEIFRAACQVFNKLWDKKTPIRQIGVHTSRVQADGGRQYNLFDLHKFDRLEILNRTIDEIRKKYGEDAVFRASFLKGNVPHMGGGLDKERRSGVTIGIDVDNEKTRIT